MIEYNMRVVLPSSNNVLSQVQILQDNLVSVSDHQDGFFIGMFMANLVLQLEL